MRRRDFRGPDDLRAMQEAVRRAWTPASRWHIGDIAWQWHSAPADARVALWDDGRAWARLSAQGHLDLFADPWAPETVGPVLDWAGARSVTVMAHEAALLTGHRPAEGAPFFERCVRDLTALPAPEVPDGYRIRAVRGEEEAAARAAAHRAAWRPARIGALLDPPVALEGESRVTPETYRDVMRAWPYRPELDQVVEAPDGSLVAFALGWLDEVNRVGELEPVGVDPRHARQGLGAAVSLACLHAMRAAGATRAAVSPRGDAAYPVPGRLYRGLGFRAVARTVTCTVPDTAPGTAATSRIDAA